MLIVNVPQGLERFDSQRLFSPERSRIVLLLQNVSKSRLQHKQFITVYQVDYMDYFIILRQGKKTKRQSDPTEITADLPHRPSLDSWVSSPLLCQNVFTSVNFSKAANWPNGAQLSFTRESVYRGYNSTITSTGRGGPSFQVRCWSTTHHKPLVCHPSKKCIRKSAVNPQTAIKEALIFSLFY